MERLWQDLRFALRLLWKDRSFTVTVVATLALCLAANIAIFAVVDSVLLKPLPFPASDRLVEIYNQYPGAGTPGRGSNGVPDFYDRRQGMPALSNLAVYRQSGATVGGQNGTDAERVERLIVSPSFFPLLGIAAYRGQVFVEAEAEPGNNKKVMLTYGAWQRLFGGDDGAVGREVRIGGEPHVVAGVLAPDFRFINPDIQMLTPAAFSAADKADGERHSNSWQQIGRLADGASVAQAQSQVDAINVANLERFPQWREILKNAGFRTHVASFQDELVADVRRTLALLWGGVFFVLVIGCVNVANLVLVRSTSRVRELATRHALGAGVGRLARQYLTETTLLALIGGVAGLGLGWWALKAAPFLGLDQLPRGVDIGIDGRVVGFTLALVAAVGVAMALLPVLTLRGMNLAQVVREEGRSGTASRGSRTARRVLVTSQVAFALLLLVGAGLMLASFTRVQAVDPGFRSAQVLTGSVSLPAARYPDPNVLRSVTQRLLDRIRALPGVQAVGASSSLPFSGSYSDSVILAEGYQMAPGESLISPSQSSASDGYFEAMGARLVGGRLFTDADAENTRKVIIIDERLARRFWPTGDAVGKRLYQPDDIENMTAKPAEEQMLTIVGVIAEMRTRSMVDATGVQLAGAYYFPMRQQPRGTLGLAIRTAQDPASIAASVRREIASVDPELPFFGVRTMAERVDEALVDRRTPALLAGGFAIVALFLAAIGIYGVLAYQVSQRRREIGIRMALGAGGRSIVALVLREGLCIVGLGAVLGLMGSFLLRNTLASQLYQVDAMEPWVVVPVVGALLVVALVACVVPARRAAHTDPVVALTDS